MPENQPIVIEASPTKMFFVNMLVKDIRLSRAILDLIDNSVDGAIRLDGERPWNESWVRVSLNPDHFIIEDNCGGIPLEVAQHYAFRFGRRKDAPPTQHSIGQFGVGMKRALFKLGRRIVIESKAEHDRFSLEIDLDKWALDDENWDFEVTDYERFTESLPFDKRGTRIEVTNLNDGIGAQLDQTWFQNSLRFEISQAHRQHLSKGLIIIANSLPVEFSGANLLSSETIKPAHLAMRLYEDKPHPVTVHVFAGLGPNVAREAGWYIFCNGRQVLGFDQSLLTGWGEDDGKTIPRFHGQFARFRGYVFFDSDDAQMLPWNTTKTGVDSESPIFTRVRREMVIVMRPIIDFLNELDREKDLPSNSQVLHDLLDVEDQASLRPVSFQASESTFDVNRDRNIQVKPKTARISYVRRLELVEDVKRALDVGTLKAVGEETFDYFYRNEIGEIGEDES